MDGCTDGWTNDKRDGRMGKWMLRWLGVWMRAAINERERQERPEQAAAVDRERLERAVADERERR